ncbi:MAG: hypothetical protein K2M86_02920, partial [Odoribacter sp.]|nr:hypothetical protein [Odoribacter sp.]
MVDKDTDFGMLYQWNRQGWIATNNPFSENDTILFIGNPCPAGWRMPVVEETQHFGDAGTRAEGYYDKDNYFGRYWFAFIESGEILWIPMIGWLPVASLPTSGYGYWTSSVDANDSSKAWIFTFSKEDLRIHHLLAPRDDAYYIRCVKEKCDTIVENTSVTIFAEDLPYKWGDTTFQVGTESGTYRFHQSNCAFNRTVNLHLTVKPCPGTLINGVCWAESNVDEPGTFADTPESYGMLYQWNRKKGWPVTGEVADWDSSMPSGESWEAANDPCPVGWRVPNIEEIKALLDESKVTSVWTSQNEVNGRTFTDGVTGNTIFLPGVHYRDKDQKNANLDEMGWYWSGELRSNAPHFAEALLFAQKAISSVNFIKYYACSVRCVAGCYSVVTDTSVTICTNDLPYTWCDTTFDVGTQPGTYLYRFQRTSTVTGCDSIVNLHLTVERPCPGVLINGVCWAEYNVDEPGTFANPGKPYGMFYQWNRKKGWPVTGNVTGWDSSLDPGNTWEPANDPCPTGWRMPTVDEIETLLDRTKVSDVKGVGQDRVVGTRYTDIATGNMIFFPQATSRREDGAVVDLLLGYYWSSTDYWTLFDNYDSPQRKPYAYGYSVRCVADENACDIVLTASENICKEELPYTWRDTTFQEGTVTGEYRIRRTNPTNGCDSIFCLNLTVDTLCGKPCKERGVLINGVCWAESNVDNPNTFADTPESFGLVYQWNRKKGLPPKGLIALEDWNFNIKDTRWEAINNPCPSDWRIPSRGEMYSLLDDLNVTREWTQQNGVNGMRFTDKTNGNTIFMPAAEFRWSISAV